MTNDEMLYINVKVKIHLYPIVSFRSILLTIFLFIVFHLLFVQQISYSDYIISHKIFYASEQYKSVLNFVTRSKQLPQNETIKFSKKEGTKEKQLQSHAMAATINLSKRLNYKIPFQYVSAKETTIKYIPIRNAHTRRIICSFTNKSTFFVPFCTPFFSVICAIDL